MVVVEAVKPQRAITPNDATKNSVRKLQPANQRLLKANTKTSATTPKLHK
ncbi:Uncharacterised protein [Vibrio cholerae]|uniref:Uncharacterized protein n=1 Tax=Vibrio cholerae TaxID=666 RepID=A0A656AU69_VIBCL|nr:Uncharacterised protein [Vibrio cholerae]CSD36712.1 Uncharacterised protein [Vibrio cholerae]CSD36884.1 Uncharacterised protein [Vibrio cholerae]